MRYKFKTQLMQSDSYAYSTMFIYYTSRVSFKYYNTFSIVWYCLRCELILIGAINVAVKIDLRAIFKLKI